jgi:hypothetical protein
MTGRGDKVSFGRLALVAGASLWVAACSGMRVDTAPSAGDEQVYTSFFPYYAEYCAVSQLKKRAGFGTDPSSGIGGHSVFYLNGVCRDTSAGYPTIKLCDGDAARHGVGLSVNAHFKNTNWVATEGRDFFFHGTLQSKGHLDRAEYQRTLAVAAEMGIYQGVEFHDEVFDDMPAGMSRREFMYDISIATDYAVGYGRDRYCARVPLDREKMARVVRYLNDLNLEYKDGKKDFEWNVLQNNCVHVTHNALAAAGIWDEWEMGEFVLYAAFDFPTPKNEFVNLMRRTNDLPLDDLMAIYQDDAARQALMHGAGLPAEPGALAQAEIAFTDNEVYDTDLALIFYDYPLIGPYFRRFREIFSEPRYSDIHASLTYFAELYARIKQRQVPLETYLPNLAPEERADFAAFYARYYQYVDRASARVDDVRAALATRANPRTSAR